MQKRLISFLCALVLLFGLFPIGMYAEATETTDKPVVSAERLWATNEQLVEVDLSIANNPGIIGGKFTVSWADGLELVSAESRDAFDELNYQKPSRFVNTGTNFMWYGDSVSEVLDGVFLTLTFKVTESVATGTNLLINVSSQDVINSNKETISVDCFGGSVLVIDYIPGDVDDNGAIDLFDITDLAQYVSDGGTDPEGFNVSVNQSATDVDDNGVIDMLDLVLICQYVSDDCQTKLDGFNVTLLPSTPKCSHTMEEIPYKAATCTEAGNTYYCHCTTCDKYYNDNKGTTEIALSSTVLAAAGHTAVTDPYVAPGYGTSGLTEGSHCSTCGETLVAQEEIPPLVKDTYYVNYVIGENDAYLQNLAKEGKIANNNPSIFEDGDSITLNSLSVPGYIFEGWYDGPGSTASQVKKLSGLTQNITLYAHWSLVEYKVQFDAPLVPMNARSFKVNEGLTLSDPAELPGYIFMGWSDEYGNLVTQIPKGTADNVTLYGNWTSQRNHTRPAQDLGTPIIHRDEENGLILFAYEIGTIENIPLSELKYIGNMMQGLSISESVTKAVTIESSTAKEVSEAVSEATTRSSEMTLSNEWTTASSISQSHLHEMEQGMATNFESAYSSSGTYNISTSKGGSTTTAVEAGVSAKIGTKVTQEASVGFPIDVIDVGAKVSTEVSAEVGAEVSTSQTDTKNWNTNEGYESSQQASYNSSVSRNMSEKISNSVTYDVSNAATEGRSSTESTATTSENTREYASSVAYGTAELEERTYTVALENAPSGYYRLVAAGRAHVFAVVTYDIASRTYGIYTYSILEDDVYPFLDFSRESAAFDDNENGVLPFEVPYFVNNYVDSIVGASDGLVIDEETGIIQKYTGSDEIVIIPQYLNVDDGDNTNVVKVTGIAPGLFANKTNVKAVQLCSNITEIPADAFNGCSSLVLVHAPSVTKIGNYAFAGCTSLKDYTVSKKIISLGTSAFTGANKITVDASSVAVADNAVASGAKNIVLNMAYASDTLENKTYTIPAGTQSFTFNGASKTYNNLLIVSDAQQTTLNNAAFVSTSQTPLVISSEDVVLNKVTVTAPGIAMKLTADSAKVGLQGNVSISTAGAHAAVTKNVQFYESNSSSIGSVAFSGNLLVSGEPVDVALVNFTKGQIIYIDSENPVVVTFDPNGGSVEETSRLVYGDTEIGELPVPTRDYYTFKGWFDSAEGGTQVVSSALLAVDTTLFAQWEENPISDWVLASELPADAEVINQKWSYTETTNTESRETSMAGYTQIGSYWVESGRGSVNYASFPGGFNTSHSIYTSFSKSALSASETATSKREVNNSWAGYVYWHWMYNTSGANANNRRPYYQKGNNPENNYGYSIFNAWTSTKNYGTVGHSGQSGWTWYEVRDSHTSFAESGGSYWWYRFDYYTSSYVDYYKMFQYQKIENKESLTKVNTSSTISNVQEWIQYRVK